MIFIYKPCRTNILTTKNVLTLIRVNRFSVMDISKIKYRLYTMKAFKCSPNYEF